MPMPLIRSYLGCPSPLEHTNDISCTYTVMKFVLLRSTSLSADHLAAWDLVGLFVQPACQRAGVMSAKQEIADDVIAHHSYSV